MGGIFSKSAKKSRITEIDRQILALKQQRDQLSIFSKKVRSQYDSAEELAKKLLREEKKVLALMALKRRKQHEALIYQTEAHIVRVNQLISNVEMATIQAEVVKALEAGNLALKSLQSAVSVELVARVIDENNELQGEVREISEMLASADDPSLVAEYARIEAQVAADLLSSVPSPPEDGISIVRAANVSEEREQPARVVAEN